MSIIEHLEALRRMLIISLVAWGIATFAAFFISGRVITLLVNQAGLTHVIYLQPAGGVLNQLKVAMYIGIIISAPNGARERLARKPSQLPQPTLTLPMVFPIAITEAMVRIGKTTSDQVHIVFQDVERANWGVNGKLASD